MDKTSILRVTFSTSHHPPRKAGKSASPSTRLATSHRCGWCRRFHVDRTLLFWWGMDELKIFFMYEAVVYGDRIWLIYVSFTLFRIWTRRIWVVRPSYTNFFLESLRYRTPDLPRLDNSGALLIYIPTVSTTFHQRAVRLFPYIEPVPIILLLSDVYIYNSLLS